MNAILNGQGLEGHVATGNLEDAPRILTIHQRPPVALPVPLIFGAAFGLHRISLLHTQNDKSTARLGGGDDHSGADFARAAYRFVRH